MMDPDEQERLMERMTDLSHLASGVGHHVINAFSAIVSNAEILRLTAYTPDAADPLAVADTIVRTAVEASGVARRLIDITRPITNIGTNLVHLDRLSLEVIESRRAEGHDEVAWVAALEPIPPIQGHERQLRAMLNHLIDNALEAMPESGGTITLSTSTDARGWIALEVHDSGRGMPHGILERAVEPFFSTKPGHPGMGLSIANGIWRRHRGTLAIRSEPGAGVRVRLCVEPFGGASPPRPRPIPHEGLTG